MTELVEAVARAIADAYYERIMLAPTARSSFQAWLGEATAAIAAVRDHDEAERKAKLRADDEAFRIWSEGVTARIKALGANVDRSKDGRERAQ